MLEMMKDGEWIRDVPAGARFTLPNGDSVSPAYDGWSNDDGYSLSAKPPPPEPTEAEKLADARQAARITRGKFCMACVGAGLLTEAEAIEAAKGDWPESFSNALPDGVPEYAAKIEWASVTHVRRMNKILLGVAAAAGVTDAQLDQMFGVSV